MESPNFNIKQAIENYVDCINGKGSLTESDKNELTSHLYDSAESLIKLGLNEEESFLIASKRIGKVDQIAKEYNKVNFSLAAGKVWVYLFTGFNVFYGIPSLLLTLLAAFYYFIHQEFNTSIIAVSIIITLHIILITGLCCVTAFKLQISTFIENQVEKKPFRLILLTSIPLLIKLLSVRWFPADIIQMTLRYHIREFGSDLVEFSAYFTVIIAIGMILSIIFSIGKVTGSSTKSLFNYPPAAFLFLFGILVEFIAASTRIFHLDNIILRSVIFGLIYFSASILLVSYNKTKNINRHLLIAISFGFLMETVFGIMADMDRERSYTAYFVSALLLGVVLGQFVGRNLQNKNFTTSR